MAGCAPGASEQSWSCASPEPAPHSRPLLGLHEAKDMRASLTLDSLGLRESQARRLMGLRGECGGSPKTEQAGSLRPLRDPRPSGLKEKKVRWRPRAGVLLRDRSQHWVCRALAASALSPQYFKVVFSCSATSQPLGPCGLQHARLLYPCYSVY